MKFVRFVNRNQCVCYVNPSFVVSVSRKADGDVYVWLSGDPTPVVIEGIDPETVLARLGIEVDEA